MGLRGLDTGRGRPILLVVFLIVVGSVLLAFGTAPVPMGQVDLQRSTSNPAVLQVVDKTTHSPLACYQLGSPGEVTAVLAMAPDLDWYDQTANTLIGNLTTASGQVPTTATWTDPALVSYDGRVTVSIRVSPTLTVQRRMSSQAEAESLSNLLQQGAYVSSRTKTLTEVPSDSEAFTLALGTPLSRCP